MCFLFPKMASIGFSRLQIYYDVRVREGTIGEDAGVQTRNVLRVMYQTGAAPESDWPYDLAKLYDRPARPTYTDAARYRLRGYSRLVSEISYLQSLAQGSPFLLGIELFESFDGDQLARTGVVTQPGSNESTLGGHDVLVVGYDLHFKDSDAFKNSGVDPALVSDRALLIRNSWGPSWSPSLQGHFYLPFDYATNPSTGGDAWVGIL
jgi:C1A family cysteine protease